MKTAWLYLLMGGLLEILWTTGLKQMDNHRNALWTVIFYVSIVMSFGFLQKSLQMLPLGTAYAIFTSIGVVGTMIVSIVFFKEPISVARIFFVLMIVGGVVGLKMS